MKKSAIQRSPKKIDLKRIKRIELAPSLTVASYDDIATVFIKKIFGIKDFMITDESMLSDFIDFTCWSDKAKYEKEKLRVFNKVKKIFGVDISKIKPLYLHKIFKFIKSKSK